MAGTLLIVEGAHDAAFFGKLIERKGFVRLKKKGDIPKPWVDLVPKAYPFEKDRLDRISPAPEYYLHADGRLCCVAVAGGDGGLIAKLRATIRSLPKGEASAIGLVVDADKTVSAADRFNEYHDKLRLLNRKMAAEENFPLPLPKRIGEVAAGPPRIGIHVFPNNADPGALETILLACAAANAPALHGCATQTVGQIDAQNRNDPDLTKLRAGRGREKATAGIIANLLDPGYNLAVSLKDSEIWLRGGAMNHPAVQQADAFLATLL